MNCPSCNFQNEDGALFCRNCGADFTKRAADKSGADLSSVLILSCIAVNIVLTVIHAIIDYGIEGWYNSKLWFSVKTVLWIISSLSNFLLPLAIRNKSIKFVGMILTAIYSLYLVAMTIYDFIDKVEYMN